jgi:hypothetical protein
MLLFVFTIVINNTDTSTASVGNIRVTKYRPITPDMSEEEKAFLTPLAYVFTDGSYSSNLEFYENRISGKFWSYIPRKSDAKFDTGNFDYFLLNENLQRAIGKNGDYLVDSNYSYNLKKGWSDSDGVTYSPTGAHMTVQSGKYIGMSNVEFRYIGYTAIGSTVENPYFPADNNSANVNYWDLNWVKKSWRDYPNLLQSSPYVEEEGMDMDILYSWWEENVFTKYPHAKTVAQNAGYTGREAEYWAERVMFETNPKTGTGVLVGWHRDRTGHMWYRMLVLDSPNKPNLRMTEMKVYDVDEMTGERTLMATATNSSSGDGTNKITNYINKYVKKGDTYEVEATVRNMTSEAPHNTRQNPSLLDYYFTFDDMINLREGYSESYIGEVTSHDQPNTILYETDAHFKWEVTIPMYDMESKIEIRPMLNEGFNINADNYDLNDDTLALVLEVAPEDIALSEEIELIDRNGNQTNSPSPGQSHKLKFIVSKPTGGTPVGEEGNWANPYTTIDITTTDGQNTNSQTVSATETLLPNGYVEITSDNVIPNSSYLKACAEINSIHAEWGQNDNPANDGPYCKIFVAENNFAVKDFSVNPGTIKRANGEPAGSEALTFKFSLINEEPMNQARNVRVVLTSNGAVLRDEKINIPAGAEFPVSWEVSNVPLSYSGNTFKIEVNPNPREFIELKKDGSNPYIDNVETTSMVVYENPQKQNVCEVVNTRNDWTQEYYIYEWEGHVEYYDCSYWRCIEREYYEDSQGRTRSRCVDKEYVERTCSYCVTDDEWTENPTISHYESFKITKVLFSSKLTRDLNGGDGKINLLTAGAGKIKAGYGFTLEVYTEYKTNRYSASPKPWSTRCSGKSVSPGYSTVVSPKTLTLEMPYKDEYGNPIYYNLVGTSSGDWDNRTVYYHLPYRDAFGIKTIPEIFINEDAKDGIYNIKIDTDNFYGSYDKPWISGGWENLCDRKDVKIQILGGNTDDLNTHIIQ